MVLTELFWDAFQFIFIVLADSFQVMILPLNVDYYHVKKLRKKKYMENQIGAQKYSILNIWLDRFKCSSEYVQLKSCSE